MFVKFSKAFDSIHRGEIEQILLAYGFPKENVTVIMMLYKNTKAMVRSPAEDTDFFDIVVGIFLGDILVPYLFFIGIDYVRRKSIDLIKENGFTQKIARSKRYTAEIITDADYADDIALILNNMQLETLASMSMQIKQSTGFLNEKELSPLKMASI